MIIAGIDEVGRGAFAGPLVAAAVVFKQTGFSLSSRGYASQKDENHSSVKINDSKKLTKRQREIASGWIRKNALAWGIGQASSSYIDKHGLTKATFYAYRQAISKAQKKLDKKIDVLIIDAFYLPRMRGLDKSKQFPFKKGDAKSTSVAAASIIAKVYRDNLMIKLSSHPKYKKYFWNTNVGYGTKMHLSAIRKYGITKHHRLLFLKS